MSKVKKIFFKLILVVMISGLAMAAFMIWDKRTRNRNSKQESQIVFKSQEGEVLGEEENGFQKNTFSSENFRAYNISFEGEAILFPPNNQPVAPEILNLRSELLTTKNERDLKFVISWRTNKPCLASVEYSREGESQKKIFSEDGFGYVHSAVLSPLNFSTTYHYQIRVRDKWGEEVVSDKMAFYTGAPRVSIFDLLGSAFKDMFGWASR